MNGEGYYSLHYNPMRHMLYRGAFTFGLEHI